jgi:hypothetical protein
VPDYSIIYPDSNALIKEGWPNISTALANLLNLTRDMKLRFVLLDPVEQELEAHFLREFTAKTKEADKKVEKISSLVGPLSFEVGVAWPEITDVQQNYRSFVDAITKQAGIERVKVPPRDINELFGMAIHHRRPFKEKGSGFQDAVICLAAIDHLAASGQKVGALLTRDGVFDAGTISALAKPKGVSLLVFENVEAIFTPTFDEYIKQVTAQRIAEVNADWERAREAVERDIPTIEKFVAQQYEIPEYSFGGTVLEVVSIKIQHVRAARTPYDQVGDGPISISAELEVEVKLILKPSLLWDWGFQGKTLKLGQAAEPDQESSSLKWSDEPREETQVRTVSVELKAKRVGNEYAEIEPVSLSVK